MVLLCSGQRPSRDRDALARVSLPLQAPLHTTTCHISHRPLMTTLTHTPHTNTPQALFAKAHSEPQGRTSLTHSLTLPASPHNPAACCAVQPVQAFPSAALAVAFPGSGATPTGRVSPCPFPAWLFRRPHARRPPSRTLRSPPCPGSHQPGGQTRRLPALGPRMSHTHTRTAHYSEGQGSSRPQSLPVASSCCCCCCCCYPPPPYTQRSPTAL